MNMRTRYLYPTAIAVTVLALAGISGITPMAADEGLPPETEPAPELDPPSLESIVVHLDESLAAQAAQWIDSDEVSPEDHGLSPRNDYFERAIEADGRLILPPHMALAAPATQPPAYVVDPSVEAGARAALGAQLGREPTPSEIDADVAAFDQRIAQINAAIEEAHGEIRLHYAQEGELPRHMEEQWLEVAPRDPALDEPSANTMLGPVLATALVERVAVESSGP